MFPSPSDRFETELCPAGGDVLLVLARREGTGSDTALHVSRDGGATLASLRAPPRIHALAANADVWVAATESALYTTGNGGANWTEIALPSPEAWAALVLAGSEAWLAGGDGVLVWADGVVRIAWRLPADGGRIAEIFPADGAVLVTSNRGRVFRGRSGVAELEDWSDGLPVLGAGLGSPTVGCVGGIWLAFLGDLFARRDGDPAWLSVPPGAPADGTLVDALRWLAPTEIAQWVAAPWERDTWVGTDGAGIFEGGPRRAPRRVWQRPDGRMSIKRVAVGDRAVFASLRNATVGVAGAVVHAGDRISTVQIR